EERRSLEPAAGGQLQAPVETGALHMEAPGHDPCVPRVAHPGHVQPIAESGEIDPIDAPVTAVSSGFGAGIKGAEEAAFNPAGEKFRRSELRASLDECLAELAGDVVIEAQRALDMGHRDR